MRALVLTLALALPLPALAQEGPYGVAIVQAPESSWGIAMGLTPGDALKAATEMCVQGGASALDCAPTNWCLPAGWTVTVGVMHPEGIHWSESVCGLPSRPAAEAVAAVLCDPASREYPMAECVLAQIYDPDGNPMVPY